VCIRSPHQQDGSGVSQVSLVLPFALAFSLTVAGCAPSTAEAERLVQSGLTAAEAGDTNHAFELFAQAAMSSPRYVPAAIASAELAVDTGDYARADEQFTLAIAWDPATLLWLEKRAAARQLAGQIEASLADNATARYNRGALAAQRGDRRAALADLERAFRTPR
jgi:tetratricopeptide (TPR) repeat protein